MLECVSVRENFDPRCFESSLIVLFLWLFTECHWLMGDYLCKRCDRAIVIATTFYLEVWWSSLAHGSCYSSLLLLLWRRLLLVHDCDTLARVESADSFLIFEKLLLNAHELCCRCSGHLLNLNFPSLLLYCLLLWNLIWLHHVRRLELKKRLGYDNTITFFPSLRAISWDIRLLSKDFVLRLSAVILRYIGRFVAWFACYDMVV